MKNFISIAMIALGLTSTVKSQTLSKETIVISTKYGRIMLKLYEETPLHKANFLKLTTSKFYNRTLFHRVISNFMIQGGDPLSKTAKDGDSLGHGDLGYTLPAEINEKLIHKRGTLCAAREGDNINPNYESSASQFYIVVGKVRTLEDLKKYEDRITKARIANVEHLFFIAGEGKKLKASAKRLLDEQKLDSAEIINKQIISKIEAAKLKVIPYKFNQTQIEEYTTKGGTPHLDGSYTVFGEVIEGYEVVEKISKVKTDKRDRPIENLRIKIKKQH